MSKMKILLAATAMAGGMMTVSAPAQAQQTRYIGEIFPAGYTFCRRGTTGAEGQLLPIASYTALFSLYGTNYGGDGRTTFGLPDLRGRLPMHVGRGAGLSDRRLGQKLGTEQTFLQTNQMPAHSHAPVMRVSRVSASTRNPIGAYFSRSASNIFEDTEEPTGDIMAVDAIQSDIVGGGQGANNIQPSLVLRYCVVLEGLYPSRS